MEYKCEPVVDFGRVLPEDQWAEELFEMNKDKYNLDRGGLDDRIFNAERMTKDLFPGTKYYVSCETYCAGCTVTVLYKRKL